MLLARLSLILCVLSVAPLAAEDGRPSAELVARNVERSYGEYFRRYPPPDPEQVIARLRKQREDLRRKNPSGRRTPEEVRESIAAYPDLGTEEEHQALIDQAEMTTREWIAWKRGELARLAGEIREVERGEWKPPRRLAQMSWGDLPPGAVGHVGPGPRQEVIDSEGIQVHQILGPDEFLGEYYYTQKTERFANRPPPEPRLCGVVLFRGLETDLLTEGKRRPINVGEGFDAVVIARYSYTDVLGAMRTVPVIEVFDPSEPFE